MTHSRQTSWSGGQALFGALGPHPPSLRHRAAAPCSLQSYNQLCVHSIRASHPSSTRGQLHGGFQWLPSHSQLNPQGLAHDRCPKDVS